MGVNSSGGSLVLCGEDARAYVWEFAKKMILHERRESRGQRGQTSDITQRRAEIRCRGAESHDQNRRIRVQTGIPFTLQNG
jgi:ATP-dependent protease ClpP protease subunit